MAAILLAKHREKVDSVCVEMGWVNKEARQGEDAGLLILHLGSDECRDRTLAC
jgi:hypothetical protein